MTSSASDLAGRLKHPTQASASRLAVRLNRAAVGTAILLLSLSNPAVSQDIEPRRWTPLPIGTNVVGVGHVRTEGDIAFDPVLKLEDATFRSTASIFSFLHAFDFLGKSARFDVRLPHVSTRWEGLLNGTPASTGRTGLGDPRLRVSVNFLGAPALSAQALREYRAAHPTNTVAGAALAVTLPLGDYEKDKLLNIGHNRFAVRPQLGVVHTRGPWSYELTGSVFFYTDNNEFFGTTLEQDPLMTVQTHLIYASPRGWWTSISAAYDEGGESRIDGVRSDDRRSDLLCGLSAGFSYHRHSSLKLAYVGSRTKEDLGADTDYLALALSIRF
jgi:hypothetical protein